MIVNDDEGGAGVEGQLHQLVLPGTVFYCYLKYINFTKRASRFPTHLLKVPGDS